MFQLKRGVQIVVGTPGRVIDLFDRGSLKLKYVKWLVLDEADEMLSMGLIDVEKILEAAPVDRQTAFFGNDAAIDSTVGDKGFAITGHGDSRKAAPAKINQVAYLVPRPWTKAKALQRILELEDPESALFCKNQAHGS